MKHESGPRGSKEEVDLVGAVKSLEDLEQSLRGWQEEKGQVLSELSSIEIDIATFESKLLGPRKGDQWLEEKFENARDKRAKLKQRVQSIDKNIEFAEQQIAFIVGNPMHEAKSKWFAGREAKGPKDLPPS